MSYVTAAGSAANTLDVQMITNIYDTSNQLAGSGASTFTISSAGVPSLTRFEMLVAPSGMTLSIVGQ